MIAVVDYGMGNLGSVQKALESVGAQAVITSDPAVILKAERIVLPGVGAFGDGMKGLQERNLVDSIRNTIESGKPFLGICLGLQLLFSESEEGGKIAGLDIIKGIVRKFPESDLKIPHMGWNGIKKKKECSLLKNIPDEAYMYFVHSYYVEPEDETVIAAKTEYGAEFTSMICKDNMCGMQFHPEKSQELGLRILESFVKC